MKGVLCSGSIVYDTLVRPVGEWAWGTTSFVDEMEAQIGGNGSNTSIAVACAGVPVRLVGTVGRDYAGRFVMDVLRQRGVDTRAIVEADTATAASIVMVASSGDRKFLHRMGVSAEAFSSPVDFTPALVDGMSHYHLSSLFILPHLRRNAPECLRRARAAGLSTSLDTNWDPRGEWMSVVAPCLPYLDLVFMNEDEARMTTGSTDPGIAAECLLGAGARMAVMKLGARGCAIYTATEEIFCPAFEVEVKDTTGAGDCFVGGFLAARLRNATLTDSGRFANAIAAISVQHLGGVAGLETRPDVEAWIRSARPRLASV